MLEHCSASGIGEWAGLQRRRSNITGATDPVNLLATQRAQTQTDICPRRLAVREQRHSWLRAFQSGIKRAQRLA